MEYDELIKVMMATYDKNIINESSQYQAFEEVLRVFRNSTYDKNIELLNRANRMIIGCYWALPHKTEEHFARDRLMVKLRNDIQAAVGGLWPAGGPGASFD